MRTTFAWIVLTAALVLLGLAAPGLAKSTTSWDGTGCTLVATPDKVHVAELRCANVLTSGAPMTQDTLDAAGVSLRLLVDHMPGDRPDWFRVFLPANLQAVPPEMELQEGSTGVILIYEWVGM